jgi:calcium-dependent protein kinase
VVKGKQKFGTHHRAIKIIKESAHLQKESNKIKLYSEIAIPI